MIPKPFPTKFRSRAGQSLVAVLCVLSLVPGEVVLHAQQPAAAPEQAAPKIPNDQLDSLVAPIALYPDPLLSQTLVASTYPLELIQLQQWLDSHKNLKGDALAAAVKKENWDPSIQAMASLPDAVKQLAGNIKWTTDLGNAFLAQQPDVMDAVQRMRAKATAAGNLKSSAQLKVETKVIETKTVVVIEQADPKVIYVPAYNPVIVYGAPIYPYPAIYYPPATGAVLAFGAGIAIGAAWGGGWGYGCGWGHNDVNVNVNNNYNKTNINNVNKSGNNNWQHNPQHRGAAPYSNSATANKYGGANRQQPAGGAANRPNGGAGASGGMGNMGANRPAGGGAGLGSSAGARPSGGASTMPASRGTGAGGGGNDRIGGHNPSAGGGGNAFGGGGMGGSSARSASNRGSHSMGGGGGRGGGGGGGRGGGGRRR